MTYELKRCYFKQRGTTFAVVVFDLWNSEFNTGYEIYVTLYRADVYMGYLEKYIKELVGCIYDISKWDFIIRNIKQKKINSWRVYPEVIK